MQENRVTVTVRDAILGEYFTRFLRERMDPESAALMVASMTEKVVLVASRLGRKGYQPPLAAVMFFPIEARRALVAAYRRQSDRLARQGLTRVAWAAMAGRSPAQGLGPADVRAAGLEEITGWRVAAHRKLEGSRHLRSLADRIEKLQAPAHWGRA